MTSKPREPDRSPASASSSTSSSTPASARRRSRRRDRGSERRPRQGAGAGSWLGGSGLLLVAILLWMLRDIVILVGLAMLLAYALDPIVGALQRIRVRGRSLPRGAASFGVVFAIVLVLCAALMLGVPVLVAELARFAQTLPATLSRTVEDLRLWATERGYGAYAEQAAAGLSNSLQQFSTNLGGTLMRGVGRVLGGIGYAVGLLLVPLLSFYLLAERAGVRTSFLRFVPSDRRDTFDRIARAVDPALRSYVRGQALVCLFMGVATGVVLGVLAFPYTVLLAVIAAFVEVVPYIGFVVAAAAIAIAGFTESPGRALLGVIVYVVLNNLVSYVVTPRVMGRHLKMHPFLVTVSVLAGSQLLGPVGVLLALPLAAVIQAIVGALAGARGESPEPEPEAGDGRSH